MKKLSLKNVGEILTKAQLKQIVGGGNGECVNGCYAPCEIGNDRGYCKIDGTGCSCVKLGNQHT